MRAVLDASLIVAAVWTKNLRSASRVVLEAAAAGAFEPVITDEIEAEYRGVLARDKLRRGAPPGVHRVAGSIMEALVAIARSNACRTKLSATRSMACSRARMSFACSSTIAVATDSARR